MQYNDYNKPSKTKTFLLPMIILLIVIGAVVAGVFLSKQAPEEGVALTSKIEERDHSLGNQQASVELIEYGDFQCPACASIEPAIKKLIDEQGGNFKFAFRHLPLKEIHKNATKAAYAAEAAHLQGKFWEYKDKLYSKQAEWANLIDPAPVFIKYAGELGLNQDQFIREMESDAVATRVDSDYKTTQALGLNSTPTFFLNGERIATPSNYDKLVEIIQNAQQ